MLRPLNLSVRYRTDSLGRLSDLLLVRMESRSLWLRLASQEGLLFVMWRRETNWPILKAIRRLPLAVTDATWLLTETTERSSCGKYRRTISSGRSAQGSRGDLPSAPMEDGLLRREMTQLRSRFGMSKDRQSRNF